MLESLKESFIEKRWASAAIILGILVGYGSAVICIRWQLTIFGFNIMYIVSPLMGGAVETFIARRMYGKSTGAISALLTFIIINIYGWLFVGLYYPQKPVTFSFVTLIAIVLTIQAAFPILTNYVFFITGVNILQRLTKFMAHLNLKAHGETEGSPEQETKGINDEPFLDEEERPLLSIPHLAGREVKKNVDLVIGEVVVKEREPHGLISKLSNIVEPVHLDDVDLVEARKLAISRMLQNARKSGADTLLDVLIDYNYVGGLQGNALIVTATGTAVTLI